MFGFLTELGQSVHSISDGSISLPVRTILSAADCMLAGHKLEKLRTLKLDDFLSELARRGRPARDFVEMVRSHDELHQRLRAAMWQGATSLVSVNGGNAPTLVGWYAKFLRRSKEAVGGHYWNSNKFFLIPRMQFSKSFKIGKSPRDTQDLCRAQ